jgi:putative tricarboxylic transport membrane protein
MLTDIASAFLGLLNPISIGLICIGVFVGMIIGAIPGMGGTMGMILFLPFTFGMPVTLSLPFLISIYRSTTYGGSVTAILLRIPGTPEAAATLLDGYPLTQQGKAGKAIGLMLYASLIGDTFSDLILIAIAVHLAKIAMKFGPAEYFTLIVFSLLIIGTVTGKSVIKGLFCGFLGLLLATIGIDPIAGTPRFAFTYELSKGLDFVAILVGLFGISEVFIQADKEIGAFITSTKVVEQSPNPSDRRCSWSELKSQLFNIFRSGLLGTFVGAIPAAGGSIACWLARGVAQNASKHPEKFGTGSLEGLAAPEAANSAVHGAHLIPLLTLGIPGSIGAAVIGAAFIMKGILPGPLMFQYHWDTIAYLYASFFIINGIILIFAKSWFNRTAQYFVSFPRAFIYPIVVIFCFLGTYLVNNSMFDVATMIMMGLLGYFLRKAEFPLPPLIIAFLLGGMAENSFRQALKISGGSVSIFFTSPLALFFVILTIVFLGVLIFREWKGRLKVKQGV